MEEENQMHKSRSDEDLLRNQDCFLSPVFDLLIYVRCGRLFIFYRRFQDFGAYKS